MAGNADEKALSRRAVLMGSGGVVGAGALALLGSTSAAEDQSAGSMTAALGKGIPVAFVMDNGATMIDFAGPWEVFQDAEAFHLYTVAGTTSELQTTGNISGEKMTGLRYRADHTFDTAPQPKIIVMGAQQGRDNPAKLSWIRKSAANADVVMSVCTGAFLLARTGLLDGLDATTHHQFYDQFAEANPKVTLIRGRRFVDNGKFVTAGGLTSGIDAALHTVERYRGRAATEEVAAYMEHFSDGWKTGASRTT